MYLGLGSRMRYTSLQDSDGLVTFGVNWMILCLKYFSMLDHVMSYFAIFLQEVENNIVTTGLL